MKDLPKDPYPTNMAATPCGGGSAPLLHTETLISILEEVGRPLEKALGAISAEKQAVLNGNTNLSQRTLAALAAASGHIEQTLFEYALNANIRGGDMYAALKTGIPEGQITVAATATRICIRLPYLPRRGHGNKAAVNLMLEQSLRQYSLPVWKKWTAAFWHIYPANTTKTPWDVDNYDYKRTIDILAAALHTSDRGGQFCMTAGAVITDDLPPGTYIEITPKSLEFPVF